MTPWALINRQSKIAIDRALLVDMAEMITVVSCGVEPGVGFALPDPDGWDHGALMRVVDSESEIQPGDRVMSLEDPDNAPSGALAFHDEIGGKPAAHLYPALEDSLDDLALSASHEGFEAEGDGDCQRVIIGGDNIARSAETSDPVESTWFPYRARSGRVLKCSNYVLPRYFTGETGKFDRLGLVTTAYELLPGGYQLVWDPTNGWTQKTQGELRAYRRRLNDLGLGRLEKRKRAMPKGPVGLLDSLEREIDGAMKP